MHLFNQRVTIPYGFINSVLQNVFDYKIHCSIQCIGIMNSHQLFSEVRQYDTCNLGAQFFYLLVHMIEVVTAYKIFTSLSSFFFHFIKSNKNS